MWSHRIAPFPKPYPTLTATPGAVPPSLLVVTKVVGKALTPVSVLQSLLQQPNHTGGSFYCIFFSFLTVNLGAADAWVGSAFLLELLYLQPWVWALLRDRSHAVSTALI